MENKIGKSPGPRALYKKFGLRCSTGLGWLATATCMRLWLPITPPPGYFGIAPSGGSRVVCKMRQTDERTKHNTKPVSEEQDSGEAFAGQLDG